MTSPVTQPRIGAKSRGAIFYDASCGLCSAGERRLHRIVERRGFDLVPLQDPRAIELLHLAPGEVPPEMKLRTPDGTVLGGADAFVHISRYVWWAWPLYAIARVPGVRPILRALYGRIARNRYRISAACSLRPRIETTRTDGGSFFETVFCDYRNDKHA
jgi:predicted DCC family thiol-disulfide oxidoreductase YuxK